MTEAEFDKLNRERIALIDKKYSMEEGLTEAEQRRFLELQKIVGAYIEEKHPLAFDKLEELEKRLDD